MLARWKTTRVASVVVVVVTLIIIVVVTAASATVTGEPHLIWAGAQAPRSRGPSSFHVDELQLDFQPIVCAVCPGSCA